MKDVEIEIQVRLEGADILEKYLNKNGKSKAENYQKDEYFTSPHKNFLAEEPVTEWLRLRESKTSSINYKKWYYKGGKSTHCNEYESEVSNIRHMRKILQALGYKTVVIVEKTRKTWLYKDYEVAIDSITNLGNFVEVEYKGKLDSIDPVKITDGMIAFLKSIGCKKLERNNVGYPYMLLYPDRQVFEAV